MILNALCDLYERLETDPTYGVAARGYSYQRVSFVVVLEPGGALHEIQDGRAPGGDGKLRPRRVLVPGVNKPSGSGLNPGFLWDNQTYLLGRNLEKPERAQRGFAAFRERHLSLEQEIGVPEFSAVCRFLELWAPSSAEEHPILDEVGPGFGVFQIRGETRFVHDHPTIGDWWNRMGGATSDLSEGQCLVTGLTAPIARLHPPIKGVAGGQSTGGAIVSFNEKAYESYGKTQSFNAPVSEDAAFRYVTALNALLDGPRRDKHRLVVGGTTVVFWTEKPTVTEDVFLRFAAHGEEIVAGDEPQDEVLRTKLGAFLQALRKGREAYWELETDPDQTSYSILGLSANAARVSVRFFHVDTLSRLLDNLRRHFADVGVERQYGDSSRKPDPEFPPAWLLLRQTARDGKDIPPLLPGLLLDAVITGARYPEVMFQSVMRRVTADRIVNYPRACIIKGHLVRNLGKEAPVSLDTSRTDPAYRLGRLFASLEKTQQDALGGGLSATIRDRFYSSASATPATVFPRLLRTYQHHLSKLEGGRRVNREKLVQEIMDPLEAFSSHLGLAEQGLFALGYYHQMRDFFRPKEDRAQSLED